MVIKDTERAWAIILARTEHNAQVRLEQAKKRTVAELDALLASGASAKVIMRIERKKPIVPGISPELTLEELKNRGLIRP